MRSEKVKSVFPFAGKVTAGGRKSCGESLLIQHDRFGESRLSCFDRFSGRSSMVHVENDTVFKAARVYVEAGPLFESPRAFRPACLQSSKAMHVWSMGQTDRCADRWSARV
jgi:hypothetical protein